MCCNDRAVYNHVEYVAFQHDFYALDTITAAFENNWAGDCRTSKLPSCQCELDNTSLVQNTHI